MNQVTRLLLVRHAQPPEEARGRCYGSLDVGLSVRGRRHAQLIGRTLDRIPLAAIYVSPSQRAVETAAPIAAIHGLTAIVDEGLREIDFGDFEGQSYDEIEHSHSELYRQWMETPTLVQFPGGESYTRLRVRALAAMEAIRARQHGRDGRSRLARRHLARNACRLPLDARRGDLPSRPKLRRAQHHRLDRLHPDRPSAQRPANDGRRQAAWVPARVRRIAAGCEDRPVSPDKSFERPPLPPDFDDSRARERRDDPAGWRFAENERAGVWRAIAERRDIRRFRTDPLPDQLLRRLLEAAHQAPSVGLMQPWRFILIRSEQTKAAMQALAARERLVQADHFDGRARQYLDLKIEGIREAPLSICVCCDRDSGGPEVLGRHTIPDTDLYSTCLAIENLWLAARAEGVGVGWVSFYQPADLSSLLGLPEHVVPVAWLCLGYPDERPNRPGLEAAGWERRRRLDELIFSERWGDLLSKPNPHTVVRSPNSDRVEQPDWWQRLAAEVSPGDPDAAVRVRDASDELVKPIGSLGGLETLIER
jgi:5,6-dimethylbenzimidazole synthase